MPPEDADLEAATAVASDAVNEAPPPDPEPEEDSAGDDDEPMTLGQARKLRRENAKWRTQLQDIEKKVEGFEPDELDAYLSMGRTLLQDPVKALPDFQRVVATIQEQYPDLTKDQAEEVAATVAEDEAEPEEKKVLTSADVAAQFRKLRDEESKEAESKSRQDAIFEEAAALDERYAVGSDYLVQLLHIARTDPEAHGTLAGAHEVLQAREKSLMEKAIEDYRKGLRDGTSHPPISKGGQAITDAKRDPAEFQNMTPKERFAAAKRSAEERLSHTFS